MGLTPHAQCKLIHLILAAPMHRPRTPHSGPSRSHPRCTTCRYFTTVKREGPGECKELEILPFSSFRLLYLMLWYYAKLVAAERWQKDC